MNKIYKCETMKYNNQKKKIKIMKFNIKQFQKKYKNKSKNK